MRSIAAPVLIGLLGCSVFLNAAPPTVWTSHGPGGGGALYSPAINPNNTRDIFVGCDMSPLFHSTDFGFTWRTVDFRQLTGSPFSQVQFTTGSSIIWCINAEAISGNSIPSTSTDDGQTWMPNPGWAAGSNAGQLFVDSENGTVAVCTADNMRLMVTTNRGVTWTQKYTTSHPNGLVLGGMFCDGNTIFLGTSDGLLVSTNGGSSFALGSYTGIPSSSAIVSLAGAKDTSTGQVRLMAVTVSASNISAGMTGDNFGHYTGIYVSNVGSPVTSGSWTLATSGIATGQMPFFVGMAANDINTAYLGGGATSPEESPCVYKTTNGGGSWAPVFHFEKNANIQTGWAGDGFSRFHWSWPGCCLGMTVCSSDSARVLISDLGCIHGTTDGGNSWKALYTSPSTMHSAGSPVPVDDTYVGNGLEPTSAWYLCWFDSKTMFGCYTDILGTRTRDAGQHWDWPSGGRANFSNTTYRVVYDSGSGNAYLANSSIHDLYRSTHLTNRSIDSGTGSVLVSADKGASWSVLYNAGHPVVWVELDPNHSNILYASVVNSSSGGIYKLTLNVNSAPPTLFSAEKLTAPPGTEGHPLCIHVLSDGTLVCSFSGHRTATFTPSSGIFKSTNGGASWTDVSDPSMKYWTQDVVIDPTDSTQNTWYACSFFAYGVSNGTTRLNGLYRTTNRGQTWTELAGDSIAPSGALNVTSCSVDPNNPTHLYFGTEYDGLFYTENLRAATPTFTQVAGYPFRNITRIMFDPYVNGEVWIGSFGNGLYSANPAVPSSHSPTPSSP